METVLAADVGRWVEHKARGLQLADGRRQEMSCRLQLSCFWLPQAPVIALDMALIVQRLAGLVVPVEVSFRESDSTGQPLRLVLDQPLRLDTVAIAKPWGQEIWFTGVEQRGVCGFTADRGSIPLPWVLASLSPWLTGGRQELILLKILDPLPQEVWGDLYFELHQQKQEVYVVSHVDAEAWPDGVGAIRFGFDPRRLAEYTSAAEFRAAFKASVAAYEAVRRHIDSQLDNKRCEQGIALDAPVAPEQIRQWQQQLSPELLKREAQLRRQMEAFSLLKPLRVGDVLKVPCLTPHALQHGVRTVEFQTPVYERKILSFAQKVLTQGHWDTAEAVDLMALEPPPEQVFAICHDSSGVLAEKIVEFSDFEVQRWRLQPGSRHQISVAGSYALIMVVTGEVALGDLHVLPEQACLLPSIMGSAQVQQCGAQLATVLVAYPSGAA